MKLAAPAAWRMLWSRVSMMVEAWEQAEKAEGQVVCVMVEKKWGWPAWGRGRRKVGLVVSRFDAWVVAYAWRWVAGQGFAARRLREEVRLSLCGAWPDRGWCGGVV